MTQEKKPEFKKQKRLENVRHERFSNDIAKGKPIYKSYLDNFKTSNKDTARINGGKLIRREDIQNRVLTLLNKEYGEEEIAEDIQDLRNATRHVYHNGELIAEHPDNEMKYKTLKLVLELRGDIKGKGVDNSVTINYQQNQQNIISNLDSQLNKVMAMLGDSESQPVKSLNKRNNSELEAEYEVEHDES